MTGQELRLQRDVVDEIVDDHADAGTPLEISQRVGTNLAGPVREIERRGVWGCCGYTIIRRDVAVTSTRSDKRERRDDNAGAR